LTSSRRTTASSPRRERGTSPRAYRQFFSEVVRRCRDADLVDGDRLYLDATLVRANASLDSLVGRPLYQQLADADEYVDRLWAENPSTEEGRSEPPQSPGSKSTRPKPPISERA